MAYVPDRGDCVWISFDPQVGREQAGRRPAVVLTPAFYNTKARLAVFCPLTNQIKGYTFEVRLPEDLPVTGAILADQVKSLDWQERNAVFIARLPQAIMDQVLGKVRSLIDPDDD